jgi:hypothetical protein
MECMDTLYESVFYCITVVISQTPFNQNRQIA